MAFKSWGGDGKRFQQQMIFFSLCRVLILFLLKMEFILYYRFGYTWHCLLLYVVRVNDKNGKTNDSTFTFTLVTSMRNHNLFDIYTRAHPNRFSFEYSFGYDCACGWWVWEHCVPFMKFIVWYFNILTDAQSQIGSSLFLLIPISHTYTFIYSPRFPYHWGHKALRPLCHLHNFYETFYPHCHLVFHFVRQIFIRKVRMSAFDFCPNSNLNCGSAWIIFYVFIM